MPGLTFRFPLLPVFFYLARAEKVKEKVKEKQGSLGKRRAKTQSKSERNVLGVFAVLFLRVAPFLLHLSFAARARKGTVNR